MSDDVSREASSSNQESDEQTFEINVKTLENEVHKVEVTKDMLVAALKEKIVDITGVPVEQQRLIFRGRVLNDDQPLSEYHVKDGHTLHMVARRLTDGQSAPGSTSADGNSNASNDSGANGQQNRPGQGPRNVIFGVNITETGEEMTDQIVRGIGEMLRSLSSGLMAPGGGVGNNQPSANAGSGSEGSQNANNRTQPVNPVQPGFAVLNHQIQVSPLPPAALIPRNMVIPDSVTTLSDFIHRMEVVLQSSVGSQNGGTPSQPPPRPEAVPLNQRGVPTPQALASVIAQARQLLTGSFASSLSQFMQHLERDAGSTDGPVRQAIQSEAMQTGILMQHLGAMLLELGRTTMTLRMSSSPEESVVNSGPSVYLNANGPNPIMVQPFPLQTSSLLSGGQIISGVAGPFSSATGAAVPPFGLTANELSVDPNAAQPIQPSGGPGDPQPLRSLAPGGVMRPVGPGGHLLSVVYPVQVRAQVSGGSASQPRTSAPQSNQSTQSSFESTGPGGLSSLVQQINAQLNNVLSGYQPGQVLQPDQVNQTGQASVTRGQGTDDVPLQTSEQVSTSGNMRSRSLSRQDVSLIRSGSDNKVNQGSTDTASSNSTVPSTSPETMQSPKSIQRSETGMQAPLGLGLAGLQPKKKVKASTKPTGDGPSQSPASASSTPQLDFQSLLSQFSSRSNPNQMQSTAQQSQAPPQRGDLGSMLSQMLQSPAINNLLTNMANQSGMGSPGEFRSVMEQCTQDPAMQNIFGDLVQQIDRQNGTGVSQGGPNAGGGIDLSRIVQQMMPVVSNVLGGGSGVPTGGNPTNTPVALSPSVRAGQNSEASLQQACARIEQHDLASNIFTSVMEGTGLYRTADADFTELIDALGSDSDLANDYMNVLCEEIRKRLQSDSSMGSRQ
ncbi:Ubiquitin family protein [Rhynchospora pubera]|uniref:Ubiquitin family protein n=1 Tax=Rhynchospora pubera TaxID=906938 RepID=A0AAV8G682_9POAL|nr:Ubiquitin family protein [Rhynchospora pubera]